MARYRFTVYENDTQPRYLIIWGLQWRVLGCQHLEPATDLSGVMAATIERLTGEGWQADGPWRPGDCWG
jgi:hypothetical protein